MRVTLSWLEEFVPLGIAPGDREAVAALSATLADLGFVPESVSDLGPQAPGVVLARVEEIAPIPGADRIRRVVVDAGEAVEVVCGAWNFAEGDLVPLARPGVVLPGMSEPMQRRKMRGVVSNGMLCSPVEVGLAEDAEGLLIVASGSPGEEISSLYGLGPDVLFDLEVQANRPDGNSVVGIARDLAARLGLPFSPAGRSVALSAMARGASLHGSHPAAAPAQAEGVSVASEDPEACPRLAAKVIRGVRVGSSPPYVARRLRLCGMRPLNSIVDASNYVMLELGQPTHPYDLARLGSKGLVARRAKPHESLTTIDGAIRDLSGAPCVIAEPGGEVVALAGIMGGASSEITGETTEILLEAAYFSPLAVSRAARSLGMRTEASARFEKGCDPWVLEAAVARFCELAGESSPIEEGPLLVTGELAAGERRISLRVGRASALLGVDLDPRSVVGLLEPMGFGVEEREVGGEDPPLGVLVPSWRPDVEREIDVVEEIARQRGYSSIPPRRRRPAQVGRLDERQRLRRRLRSALISLGALECWSPTIVNPALQAGLGVALVELANPLVKEESALRASLLPGLVAVLGRNLARGAERLSLFELGRVFAESPSGAMPDEREVAGLLLAAGEDSARAAVRAWKSIESTLRLQRCKLVKSAAGGMHPSRCATIEAPDGAVVGTVGEVDPDLVSQAGLGPRRCGWLEIDLRQLATCPRRPERIAAPSRFPSAEFDLAFAVPDAVAAQEVEEALVRAGGDELEALWLFDSYRGPSVGDGRRSLAWRLRFAAADHTLSEEEVASHRDRCVQAIEGTGLGRLRG